MFKLGEWSPIWNLSRQGTVQPLCGLKLSTRIKGEINKYSLLDATASLESGPLSSSRAKPVLSRRMMSKGKILKLRRLLLTFRSLTGDTVTGPMMEISRLVNKFVTV